MLNLSNSHFARFSYHLFLEASFNSFDQNQLLFVKVAGVITPLP